jgi:hypothetical protein
MQANRNMQELGSPEAMQQFAGTMDDLRRDQVEIYERLAQSVCFLSLFPSSR